MIDIQTALYNILHSRYGSDVRQSIHDGIYQINENANEAVQTAKAMGVGTAINSASSSSSGYVSGNLYLNSQTWDLWQCVGTNSWQNKGNIKGATGSTGADGTSNYIFIRFSANYDGTDFTVSPTASSQFLGVYYGASSTAPTNKQDYQWTSYVGASGTSAYVHIMYSEDADGSNFVSVPTANTKYVGFYSGTSSTAPANKAYYTWSKYVGSDGTGNGDMTKTEYAGSGVVGTVDKALNLRKTDGSLLSADNVSTKLSKIPNGNGTSGQVITSDGNGGATWGAGGHEMLSTVASVEALTSGADNKVVNAYVVKGYANRYTVGIESTLTANNNEITITDSAFANDDATFEFMFEPTLNASSEYEVLTLSKYELNTSTGQLKITVATAPTVNTKIRVDVTVYREEI